MSGLIVYSLGDTINILEIVKQYKLQLMEIDCIHLFSDGSLQPDMGNDIKIWNLTFEEIRNKLFDLNDDAHFEMLDLQDLLLDTNEKLLS